MKGRQSGRPTKWVDAAIQEPLAIGKPGIRFDVWRKWGKKGAKMGKLTVNVGGLRWQIGNGKIRRKTWEELADWFEKK